MRVASSFFYAGGQRKMFVLIRFSITFASLLALAAIAQASGPPPELHGIDSGHEKAGKRDRKHDVSQIGQRDIAHGINLYSINRERALGERLAASVDQNTKFINDPLVTDYVNALGQKLVRNSDAEVPFTIKVIDSDGMRALSLPGGFLYVDRGLITASDCEAELASVMAHEIAHVAARHATRAVTRQRLSNVLGSMLLFAGPASVALENVAGVAGPLSSKKFSRDAEYEADLLGIQYTYAAGYDPEAFLVALEKLHANELKMTAMYSKIPGYRLGSKLPFHHQIARGFSSYPLTEERIRRIQAEIATLLPDKQQYILNTSDFQDVKTRILASEAPRLVRHRSKDDKPGGPVLRRGTSLDANPGSSLSMLPASR